MAKETHKLKGSYWVRQGANRAIADLSSARSKLYGRPITIGRATKYMGVARVEAEGVKWKKFFCLALLYTTLPADQLHNVKTYT